MDYELKVQRKAIEDLQSFMTDYFSSEKKKISGLSFVDLLKMFLYYKKDKNDIFYESRKYANRIPDYVKLFSKTFVKFINSIDPDDKRDYMRTIKEDDKKIMLLALKPSTKKMLKEFLKEDMMEGKDVL